METGGMIFKVEMHVRDSVPSTGGDGLQFPTTPTSISGGHFAGGTGHGEDQAGHHRRAGHRQDDLPQRLPALVAPSAREPGGTARGIRARPPSVATITTGTARTPGSARPRTARGYRRSAPAGPGEEQPVDGTAQHVDEETQAEHAVDDRRYAGEVVHGDADHLGQRPLAWRTRAGRPQRSRRTGDDQRHHQGHHHGAEDRREAIPPSVLASRGSSLRNSQSFLKYTVILVPRPMALGW